MGFGRNIIKSLNEGDSFEVPNPILLDEILGEKGSYLYLNTETVSSFTKEATPTHLASR
jgi:hypothetical protein